MTGPEPTRRGPAFVVGALVGWALIAWAVRGILVHHVDTRPPELARFLLGGLVLHDVVLVPSVLAAAWCVQRLAPRRARAGVQAALVVSGCLVLFAFPLVRGYGRALGNPTSLPHDYAANLLAVLAVVWLVAVLALALGSRTRLRRRAPGGPR